jgi:hypothetical protein
MQKKALEKPEGYEFEAQLPEIVGYVPEDERPYFDNLPAEALVASHNSWKCLPKELRGLERIIKDDYDQFNLSGHGSFMHIELERKTTSPGFFARPPGYHTDGVLNRLNINSLRYIVANRCTTIFYGGIARYESDKLGMIAIDPASLDQSKPCISAPFYGIVRLSGATIHASPKF